MLSVEERARRYIRKCSLAISGQGGHNATFRVAAVLVHGFALDEVDALALLREWNSGCVPPWSDADLAHKVRSAASAQHLQPRGYLLNENGVKHATIYPGGKVVAALVALRSKPLFRPMVLKRIAAKLSSAADVIALLNQLSPVRVDTQDSASVLRRLYTFGSGEKVLIFSKIESQGQMLWEASRSDLIQHRDLPMGDDGVWFLPQPVDGKFHRNPRLGGKMSRRSEESVASWRYLVLESDEADPEEWLRCLVQMPLRLACICESGRRSIHALVKMDAMSKVDWDAKVRVIKPVLVTLGADPAALTAVRLTRLPQARRGDRVQQLLYLNPAPQDAPIIAPGCKVRATLAGRDHDERRADW